MTGQPAAGRLGTYWRLLRVTWQFLPLLVAYARDRRRYLFFGGRRRPGPGVQKERADILVDALIELGPTFIKLGQLLSTRPDILPPVYIDRLSQLQDDVPPAPWPETKVVIEDSIGPIEDRFSTFDTDPISGASLGQVYRAEIDGEPVAVKVRRPGVTARVETDLRVLQRVQPILLYFVDDARAFSFENLAEEFARVIREEMDYEREATMLKEIKRNFADDPGIRVPDTLDSHCTDRVLTMAYVEGTKITDVKTLDEKGIDRHAVAERLERAYLQMVIEDGVFHADPHPGNLAVQEDGTIVFYDFGMSGRVDEDVREHIVSFYVSVAERDIDGILDALVALGTLSPDADRYVMGQLMELAIQDARGERIEQWRVQQIISRVESTMYEFPLRLPSRLALVMRVATVVEGVCVTLDEDFDFISVATSFLSEQGYREESIRRAVFDTGQAVGEAGLAAVRSLPKLESVLDRFEHEEAFVRVGIEDPNRVIDRLGRRIVYGLFTSFGVLSAAIIYAVRGIDPAAIAALVIAVISLLALVRSFRRRSRLGARPQFTRQNLRERRSR